METDEIQNINERKEKKNDSQNIPLEIIDKNLNENENDNVIPLEEKEDDNIVPLEEKENDNIIPLDEKENDNVNSIKFVNDMNLKKKKIKKEKEKINEENKKNIPAPLDETFENEVGDEISENETKDDFSESSDDMENEQKEIGSWKKFSSFIYDFILEYFRYFSIFFMLICIIISVTSFWFCRNNKNKLIYRIDNFKKHRKFGEMEHLI
jgi:hypothetical protein